MEFVLTPKIKFDIDRESTEAFSQFTYLNPEMAEEMKSFLKLTDAKICLLDIGALYGIFSLAFTCNNPKKSAYAMEPSFKPFNVLGYHKKINPLCNIKPFQLALGSQDGKLKMKYEWQHLVALSKNEKTASYIEVNVTTLDNFLKKHNIIPDCVKIDTEGFEYDVLKGGSQYFLKHNPIIFLEVHIPLLKQHGLSAQKLEKLIYSFGYKIYDLKHNLIKSPSLFFNKNPNCRVVCIKNE